MKAGMRFLCLFLVFLMPVGARGDFTPSAMPRSYILMDYDTGTVMTEYEADAPMPIASVTKVMTMLLCMEAVQAGKITMEDMVTASEYACSMGGSQIYLEPGEQMSVTDMLKSIAVSSANDASVAMAEHIMGSESSFVEAMNERAKSLGMNNTNFENCNGLDTENHYSSARDVAIMSRELLKHPKIHSFLNIWMDTVRDGKFGLSNTNKLIRFYDGAMGIKTGSTSLAKYCLSAAAKRDGLTLVSVVLGAETTNERFSVAKELLNYGFANYKVATFVEANQEVGIVTVKKGKSEKVAVHTGSDYKRLTEKQNNTEFEKNIILPDSIKAPIKKGQEIGKMELKDKGKVIGEVPLVAAENVEKTATTDVFLGILKQWMLK